VIIGKIEQLTTLNETDKLLSLTKPLNYKVITINTLKKLREDYILTEDEESIDKVINWLINCTPEYK